jgi:hypothetical protein
MENINLAIAYSASKFHKHTVFIRQSGTKWIIFVTRREGDAVYFRSKFLKLFRGISPLKGLNIFAHVYSNIFCVHSS